GDPVGLGDGVGGPPDSDEPVAGVGAGDEGVGVPSDLRPDPVGQFDDGAVGATVQGQLPIGGGGAVALGEVGGEGGEVVGCRPAPLVDGLVAVADGDDGESGAEDLLEEDP